MGVPFHSLLVHQHKVANQQSWFHAARRDPNRLHDESHDEQGDHENVEQRLYCGQDADRMMLREPGCSRVELVGHRRFGNGLCNRIANLIVDGLDVSHDRSPSRRHFRRQSAVSSL